MKLRKRRGSRGNSSSTWILATNSVATSAQCAEVAKLANCLNIRGHAEPMGSYKDSSRLATSSNSGAV